MSRAVVDRLAIPKEWYERDRAQVAKLGLLWALWIGGGLAIHRLLGLGAAGIAGAAAVSLLLGGLVVSGIGFIGHDVGHGSVVTGERTIRLLTFFSLTAALFVPYFLWVRWHNTFHHRYANSRRDSDRLVRLEELESGLVSYPAYALANTCGFSLQYVALRMWRIVYGGKSVRSDRKKRADIVSLAALAAIHVALFLALPAATWGLAVAVPLTVSIVVVSYYIQSNHFLRPQSESFDPVKGSTDVSVPAVMDFFHSNFSCHTAHHVFPAVPSSRYPAVTERIAAAYPADYLRVPFLRAAWDNFRLPKIVRGERFRVTRRGAVRAELR